MAVYTQITEEEARSFLADYALAPLVELRPILEGVSNTNYHLITENQRAILTLFEPRTDTADLPWFMDLTAHLARKGLAVPQPIPRRDGGVIGEIRGRKAVVTRFLEGQSLSRYDTSHLFSLGETLAALHRAGADFPETCANRLRRTGCHNLIQKINKIKQLSDIEYDNILNEWPKNLPSGPIHADLFPDNVFFDSAGKVSGLIDFYFACTDAFAYDLAICLNAWCFDESLTYRADWGRALMGGYEHHRPLSESEWEALPALAHAAALRFFLTRQLDWLTHDPDSLVTPKNPQDFRARLDFHAKISHGHDYLV